MKKLKLLLAFTALFCLINTQVWATDTGWLRATTYNNNNVLFPEGAFKPKIEDYGKMATFYYSNNSSIDYGGFGISIPEGERITGIEIQLIGTANPNNLSVNISWNNGSDFTTTSYKSNFSGNYTLSAEYFGSPADLWGKNNWIATELRNENFLVRLALVEGSVPGSTDLDFIAVKVYYQSTMSPITFLSNGTFVVPEGVTEVTVQAWGAGGKGGGDFDPPVACGGGGGGAYVSSTLTVTPGAAYTVQVGRGDEYIMGLSDSWFGSTSMLLAKGGTIGSNHSAGDGGSAYECIGDVKYGGGNGASGDTEYDDEDNLILLYSSGGGSSAGTTAAGTGTSNYLGGIAPEGGGNGGNGVQWNGTSGPGNVGSFPGGGGGGAISNSGDYEGGDGSGGQVIVSWESSSCAGSAVAVYDESGVTNSKNSLGAPDGLVATLEYDYGSWLYLDLTTEALIAPGNTITILWRKVGEVNPLVDVDLSNEITGWEIVASDYEVSEPVLTEYSFPVNADTRYIVIYIAGPGTLEVDAVTYTCTCLAPTPGAEVVDYNGHSVLTATGYTGDLRWNTGETSESITVYDCGKYSVSQKVGDCLSLSAVGEATPHIITLNSIIGSESVCAGETAVYSIEPVEGATRYSWDMDGDWTINSGNTTNSLNVTVGNTNATLSIHVEVNSCISNTISKLVTVDTKCCIQGEPDKYEPNNTMQAAALINVGDPAISANILDSKDADWFYFVTGDAGLYLINYVKGSTAETMALYNSSARKLKPTDRTGTTYSLLGGTTYYIKVSAKLRSPAPCYSLGVEMSIAALFASEQFDDLKSAEIETTPDGICKIWPNPTNNEFQIYNGNEYPIQMKVMDVTGRQIEIINKVGIAETVVFGSKYKPGVYFVNISENGVQKVFKVIKQ